MSQELNRCPLAFHDCGPDCPFCHPEGPPQPVIPVVILIVIVIAIVVLSLLLPARAHAQGLRLDRAAFAGTAAADWTSTYRILQVAGTYERNPLLAGLTTRPKTLIATGAGIDVAGSLLWERATANHERWQRAGYWTAAAFRTYLAIQNERTRARQLRINAGG